MPAVSDGMDQSSQHRHPSEHRPQGDKGVFDGLSGSAGGRPILWGRNRYLSREDLLDKVGVFADQLPDLPYAVNLCNQRGAFMVGLMAALQRGQVMLLPPSRTAGVLRDFKRRFPKSHAMIDADGDDVDKGQIDEPLTPLDLDRLQLEGSPVRFSPRPEQIAAVAFTSGSTGEVKAHEKTWESVTIGAKLAAKRFGLTPDTGIVATVPPQHMYGLETSIFYPLIAGCSVHASRPVLPTEIQKALAEVDTPKRLLITTPIHLRSMVKTPLDWPKIDAVISATAPLSVELAGLAEKHLKAPVYEIYGCTEAGSIASRRTVESDIWQFYDGVEFSATDTEGRPVVLGGHVMEPTPLSDVLDQLDNTRFRLIGRAADQVGIAGKRASLGDLNRKLCAIDGIEDGVFIARGNDGDGKVQRLGCLYVSASLDERAVMAELRSMIDPAFLPRPIRRVPRLPYNELGKLPRQQLLAALSLDGAEQAGKSSTSAA